MVYVTQQPGTLHTKTGRPWTPNLESAEKYGPLKFVFDIEEIIALHPNESLSKAIAALSSFNAAADYLLWPGVANPLSLFCCTAALVANFEIKEINVLVWNRNFYEKQTRDATESGQPHAPVNGFYTPVKFMLEGE